MFFRDFHSGIDGGMRRNAIHEAKLEETETEDGADRGSKIAGRTTGELFDLVIEPALPCDRPEHETGEQAAIGGRKVVELMPQQHIREGAFLVNAPQNLDCGAAWSESGPIGARSRPVHIPSRSPIAIRRPRMKSAAGIRLRPAACTSTSTSRPRPHWTIGARPRSTIVPGSAAPAPSWASAARWIISSSPRIVVRAIGHGSYARTIRSMCEASAFQSIIESRFSIGRV